MKILIIDGPHAGQVRDIGDNSQEVVVHDKDEHDRDQRSHYYVHGLYLLGRIIQIGSLQVKAGRISDRVVLEHILSDGAKETLED